TARWKAARPRWVFDRIRSLVVSMIARRVMHVQYGGSFMDDCIMKTQVKTARPWEEQCGYSRAVRVGNMIDTSLTSPASETGAILFPGNVYKQTLVCLDIIKLAIEELGGSMDGVFRTRIYLADPRRWAESGRAHKEVFGDAGRTLGWIYMSGFFNPDIAVEVECSAYCER
ncbi:MAG: Rid family hydrolase, partial [Alphaproteobacteria bacterium]